MYSVIKYKYFATSYQRDKRLSSLNVNEDEIVSIVKSLNSNKSHGWGKLSIKMMKMCNKTLVYPLKLLFKASFKKGVFLDCWKKLILYLFTEKKVKIFQKSMDKLAFFKLLAKYTTESFLKNSLIIFIKIIFYRMSVWFFPG